MSSETTDIREITLGPGHRIKLHVGDSFIMAESGVLQVNLLPSESRKLGQALVAAADHCETRAVARRAGHGG